MAEVLKMVQTHIVVGAGIVGAATAFQLSKAGDRVIVIDGGRPDATSAAFGWINASFFLNEDHHFLRAAGIHAWRRVMEDIPVQVYWQGCICWDLTEQQMQETYAQLRAHDYPAEMLTASQVLALEPQLKNAPEQALLFPGEGAAPSQVIAGQFLAAAKDLGAKLITNVYVDSIKMRADRAVGVDTAQGAIMADSVIIAAGTGTAALANSIGRTVSLVSRPAYIMRTARQDLSLRHVLATPSGEIRQEPDGRLLLPVAVGHQRDDSETLTQTPVEAADGALVRLQTYFDGLQNIDWSEIICADRPVPEDGLPVIGPIADGVYAAVLHSGITLGPIIAELVAKDIAGQLSNEDAAMLAPYHPDRLILE